MTGPAEQERDPVYFPILGQLYPARISSATRHGLARGLLHYRWLTWLWLSAIYSWEVYRRNVAKDAPETVAHPVAGFALVGLMLAFTIYLTISYRKDPDHFLKRRVILTEIGICALVLSADVWVYGFADHAQSVPSIWVVASVFATAIAAGQRAAIITGIGLGLARYIGWLPFAAPEEDYLSLTRLATMVLLTVAAWTTGYLLKKLEAADNSITTFRAREEVSRTLHDGVLQTLAVIQRRSEDTELVELARTQELELREYLFGGSPIDDDLAAGLRSAARKAEERYGIRVEVITAPDLPRGSPQSIHALAGAVTEALTNASKHGQASKATIYAEPTEAMDGILGLARTGLELVNEGTIELFVSVKDNGVGFDPEKVKVGEGLSRSIRARIEEAGGRVEVDGRIGRGAEIRMWV